MIHTAADIVSLVRSTNGSEFLLSGSEAELLVNLFASAAASEAAAKASKSTAESMLSAYDAATGHAA